MPAPAAQLVLAATPALHLPDGRCLPLAPRDALLAAWLAIEGPTPRARLAALLWPEAEPGAARNALRQRLFQLRRQLGFALVEGEATLALAAGTTHDLDDADDLLAGCEIGIAGEAGQWVALQRRRRQERLRLSLAELATMAEQARDWDDALAHARELVALDPLSEAAHRRLIRLHYLAGDRAAALRAFDTCEAMLKHEVGTRPSPETLALLATVEAAVPPAADAGTTVPVALLRPPRLLGRDTVRAALVQAVHEGRSVLLRGEPGMGKSRLLDDLSDRLPGPCLRVGARPGDAGVPFALAGRWLRALLAVGALEPGPAQRPLLAHLLPGLGAPEPAQPADLAAAVEALWMQAVAAGLRVVVIDDLQFGDAASLTLLDGLAGRDDASWIVAARPAELEAPAAGFCAALGRRAGTLVLDLPPLDGPAVAELLASLDLPALPQSAAALQARTGGNPLYVLETIKAALLSPRADGPAGHAWPAAPGVLRLIQQRLMRLSAPALRLARCAAIAGQDTSPALAAAVLGTRVLDLADAWAELESAQVLRGDRFAHDLIAEAALASVPAPVARPLHAEVAAWLEAQGGEPARVAWHWLAAGQGLRAVPALVAAGRKAAGLWQHETAADQFERAADLLRDAGRRSEAFDVYLQAAEARSAYRLDDHLRRLGAQLDALADDDVQRAWAACVQVALCAEQRRFAEARSLAESALALARRAGAADAEVELLWSLTVLDWDRRELADAVRHAEAALARLAAVDPATQRLDLGDTHLKLLHALGVFQG
ncbi:MAG: AAA family ATPase, partial [Rhodoferax sp.]|nr:AAA family ATPase [Rhodoferax sp.]